MKEYQPQPWIPFPRYVELMIQFPIIFLILHALAWVKGIERLSIPAELLTTFIMFLTYKFLGTSSAVDQISIDFENKIISITYWYFYCLKKKISIEFDCLDFKNKHTLLITGGYSIYFYANKILKIKLNERNGWKGEQLDEIIEDLLRIKEPVNKLVPRIPE